MNKKLVIGIVSIILMLVTISFASALSSSDESERKASPLFNIRTETAIKEQLDEFKSNIRAKFIGSRLFFIQTRLTQADDNLPIRTPSAFCKTFPVSTCSSSTQYDCCKLFDSPPQNSIRDQIQYKTEICTACLGCVHSLLLRS